MKRIANYKHVGLALLTLAMPLSALAQQQGDTQIDIILQKILNTLNFILIILFALITLFFIWGVIQYVMAGGDEDKIKTGKQHMLWGLIGLAVVAAAWGISNLLLDYIGVDPDNLPNVPRFGE